MGATNEGLTRILGADPVPWLLASDEPAAQWLTLTAVLDRPLHDLEVGAAHEAVLAEASTRELVSRLHDWEVAVRISGHNSPAFVPNLLWLLARMGVRAGDFPEVEEILDAMLRHQDGDGRFEAIVIRGEATTASWGALLCDTHAIAESLIRFGRTDDAAVRNALDAMARDIVPTAQGSAWQCRPSLGFRGPGRKNEACPQVTVEALRTLGLVPPELRPAAAIDTARTLLGVWRNRAEATPYMFGHGLSFKTVKWPPFWYSDLALLDAVSGFPELWRGPAARPEDRRSIAELAACLVAYNVDADGRVTPQSCYQGFEGFSFGQKKVASPFATALVAAVLRRFDDLSDEVVAIDVLSLGSSKGGSGTARPPKRPRAPGAS